MSSYAIDTAFHCQKVRCNHRISQSLIPGGVKAYVRLVPAVNIHPIEIYTDSFDNVQR